jgi:type II secretory pathway component PulF
MLDQMMNRIADYLEQEIALRRLISRLTLYPKITIFLALFILGKSFFTDALPAFSKLVIGSMGKMNYSGMDYLNDTLFFLCWIGLGAFAITAFCRIVLFQSAAAQESYERIKMSIPGLGTVARKFALAKFGHAFGAMYAGGLPLNTAIQVAGNASGSKVVGRATTRAIYSMERGTTLSQAFRETGAFPPIVLDMLHTGEQTGNVDAMMSKVAEYLEGDAEQKAHAYSHIFAATVGLIVAMFIGYAIIKFYTQLGSNTAEYLKDNPNMLPGLK